MKKPFPLLALLVAVLGFTSFSPSPLSSAPSSTLKEYEIKAAFLYQFTKFVEWPEQSLNKQNAFSICVIGQNPFGEILTQLESEKVHTQQVKVVNIDASAADTCHVVFISAAEGKNVSKIIGKLRGKSILTISEVPHFLEAGGLINFVKQEKNIRFQINQRDAEQSGIKISSKLLKLAERVVS